jgi:hypothetical protein
LCILNALGLETNHQLANEGLARALEHPMASNHDPKSEFGKLNITSLHQHDLRQKTLIAPLKKLPAPLRLSSWKDERLPNLLWAAVVATYFPRDRVLNLFREITNIGSSLVETKHHHDRSYDWTSAYTHANWSAVRDTVFVTCLNPLHRFHRIPELPKLSMPSTLEDASRLINRMLDDLNHLYPTIKGRIGWHNRAELRKPKREKA